MATTIKELNKLAKRAGCVFKIDTNNIIYHWELTHPKEERKGYKTIMGNGFNHNFQIDDVPKILEVLDKRIKTHDRAGYFIIEMLYDYFDIKKESWYVMTYDEMIVLDDENSVCPVNSVMYKIVGRLKIKTDVK